MYLYILFGLTIGLIIIKLCVRSIVAEDLNTDDEELIDEEMGTYEEIITISESDEDPTKEEIEEREEAESIRPI
jgi:hypothetical protein